MNLSATVNGNIVSTLYIQNSTTFADKIDYFYAE